MDSTKDIGSEVALFAMGSLAGMVKFNNPNMLLNGTVPYLGSRVHVYQPALAIILICLIATQSTVFVLTYMIAV